MYTVYYFADLCLWCVLCTSYIIHVYYVLFYVFIPDCFTFLCSGAAPERRLGAEQALLPPLQHGRLLYGYIYIYI